MERVEYAVLIASIEVVASQWIDIVVPDLSGWCASSARRYAALMSCAEGSFESEVGHGRLRIA